ncbi:mannose-1-phosphate guanylyltransferase/mannose-6-phosphate isomerase [Desulfovermiculus halophilus]|uniref:mannose-1-phosphate guanylyltransferase/mannose-6-phosphate isomerase n=1 Tax=Desulfovermiculus halophilus TaxID=339722 RepID=UPI0006854507|nr:mannose-1-phosphate guanylyltransferase/mannose-6-phosphate isomerase [Desulfovermiculus halophilus]
MLTPVVLSGGSGTRLWPLSRKRYPKQFLPMLGGRETMLQATLRRLAAVDECAPPMIVCNQDHRFTVAAQAQELGVDLQHLILEPVPRNTAPAIAAAALIAMKQGDDPLLLVLPADHHIADPCAFARAVAVGEKAAAEGALVTFGILPDRPETGYGYIQTIADGKQGEALPVQAFVEKPDRATAEGYLETGEYLWNSGMFLFQASTYLHELEQKNPAMLDACRKAAEHAMEEKDFFRLDQEAFAECPSDSIDYAVMEKTDRAMVVPLACGWSDIGSWAALQEVMDKDPAGNVCIGDVYLHDVRTSYIHADSRLIAALGVDNLVVVDTQDTLFISTLDRVQEVKTIVSDLKAKQRREAESYCFES